MTDKEQNRSEVEQSPTPKDGSTGMNLLGKDRRRFIKRAIIAAPFILTVTSRPVWACNCTLSGMLSGNISDGEVVCEGCSPGFWKNGNWPKYLRTDEFNFVFEVSESFFTQENCTTLDDVIHIERKPPDRDSDLEVFGFHAVAALLNAVAASYGMLNFGYTERGIINMVKNALHNGNILEVKDDLDFLNNQECPLPNNVVF